MKITLNHAKWGRAECTAVALPECGGFEFVSDTYILAELVVHARNGNKTQKIKTRTASADLSALMFAGRLEMSVCLIVSGKEAKKWSVPPILLTETDGTLYAFDEVESLRHRIEELEKKTTVMM